MFGFGSKLFLEGTLNIVVRNMYVVVISKLFTATIAGYYFFVEKTTKIAVISSTYPYSIPGIQSPAIPTPTN